MNVQRLKDVLEATGCPIAIVRVNAQGVGSYMPGPGATTQQIAAADAALAQHLESGVSAGDIEYEHALVRVRAENALDIGFGRELHHVELALRAVFLMLVEDRYNTVQQFNALLTQIANATSLADLKARVGANVQPLPPYGATAENATNAIKNALKQRISRKQVD